MPSAGSQALGLISPLLVAAWRLQLVMTGRPRCTPRDVAEPAYDANVSLDNKLDALKRKKAEFVQGLPLMHKESVELSTDNSATLHAYGSSTV